MPELLQLSSGTVPVVHQHARPTGFVEGTIFVTDEGERPVEHLLAGDRVMTAENGLVELRGTSVLVACDIDVICFHAASSADGEPLLVVPAMQQVMASDWHARTLFERDAIMTPAGSLVDGKRITRETRPLMRLFRLHFDSPQQVVSRGFVMASEKTRAPLPYGLSDEDAPVERLSRIH